MRSTTLSFSSAWKLSWNIYKRKKKKKLDIYWANKFPTTIWYRWCKCHPISIIIKWWFLSNDSVQEFGGNNLIDQVTTPSHIDKTKKKATIFQRNTPLLCHPLLTHSSSHIFHNNRTNLYSQTSFICNQTTFGTIQTSDCNLDLMFFLWFSTIFEHII